MGRPVKGCHSFDLKIIFAWIFFIKCFVCTIILNHAKW